MPYIDGAAIMDTQTALANEGAPFTIDYNGKKLKLRYRTQKVKAEFEQWAKDRAIKSRLASRSAYTAAELQAQLDKLYEAFDSDDPSVNYSFDGARCSKLRETDEGRAYFIRLMLGKDVADFTSDQFDDLLISKGVEINTYIEACNAKLNSIYEELGWNSDNRATDPEGKTLDGKKLREILIREGMW